MLPFRFFPDPLIFAVKLVNSLIRRESWAMQRLQAHAGKTVGFDFGLRKFALVILHDGQLRPADGAAAPDVSLSIAEQRWKDLPAVLRSRDPDALAALMRVHGDAALAQVVSDIARELRWDVEDDLSRIVGDVAAVRIVTATRSAVSSAPDLLQRLMENIAEYLSEESAMLVARPAYEPWAAQVNDLQSRIDEIERRMSRLRGRRIPLPSDRQTPPVGHRNKG